MSKLSVVHSDPEILGGTPVFRGMRVPSRNLFDYLERGHHIDAFVDAIPSVSREQAIAVLETAHEALTADARVLLDEQLPRPWSRAFLSLFLNIPRFRNSGNVEVSHMS